LEGDSYGYGFGHGSVGLIGMVLIIMVVLMLLGRICHERFGEFQRWDPQKS
jgi:hypothetical protein